METVPQAIMIIVVHAAAALLLERNACNVWGHQAVYSVKLAIQVLIAEIA